VPFARTAVPVEEENPAPLIMIDEADATVTPGSPVDKVD
jgi:hypothetical protein